MGGGPVSERVGGWLSSLSAKYIGVFVLLVAVPAIGISWYLLDSSYNDNKAALIRLQQEKAKSVAVEVHRYFLDLTKRMQAMSGQYLNPKKLGGVLQPLLETTRPRRSTWTVPGTRRSQLWAADCPRSRGTTCMIV